MISKQRNLFSVMGRKLAGNATALIIADDEADAEYYALHELSFVSVAATIMVSDFYGLDGPQDSIH